MLLMLTAKVCSKSRTNKKICRDFSDLATQILNTGNGDEKHRINQEYLVKNRHEFITQLKGNQTLGNSQQRSIKISIIVFFFFLVINSWLLYQTKQSAGIVSSKNLIVWIGCIICAFLSIDLMMQIVLSCKYSIKYIENQKEKEGTKYEFCDIIENLKMNVKK